MGPPSSPGRGDGGRIPGSKYPLGGRGCSETSGRSAPLPACPAGSPFLPRNGEKEGRGSTSGPPVLWPARCHSLVWGLWRMVPAVGLFRGPGACPDLGAFFRGIFLGHIGGHVEQNSVCGDTDAVDERNQPHLVFWLYFITFLQYFPLFFRISLPPWGALLSPGREGGARIPGSTYPSGGRGCYEASGRSAPLPARPRAGARLSLEESRRKSKPLVN